MMCRALLVFLLALCGQGCTAQEREINPDTGLSGWNEAVINTRTPQLWHDLFVSYAGWELRASGPVDQGLRKLWSLPEDAVGEQWLYANKGADSGFIRIVRLERVEQQIIRVNDRPWDTGGYFDFNVRVLGLHQLHKQLTAIGWQGDSEPLQYSFGPFEVIEWIARGPDGVRIAFIERLNPPLEGWPILKTMSRTFNATQTVRDMPAARSFFEDVLGMKIYLEHRGASAKPGPNVLGLPFEAAAAVDRLVYILHPDGSNEGSIELLAFDGAGGRDLSARAAPHNLGFAVLRYPVENLDKSIRAIKARGGHFDGEPVTVQLPPYGTARVVGMGAPDGARIELYETLKQ